MTVASRMIPAARPTASGLISYSVQDAYIYGFALQEKALPSSFDDPAESARIARRVLQQVPAEAAGEYPYTIEMVGGHIAQHGYDYKGEFEFGLDLILDGLERRCL